MIIEISEIFLYNSNLEKVTNINITENVTIEKIIERLCIQNTNYALILKNNKVAQKKDFVNNEDKITILPICGGG